MIKKSKAVSEHVSGGYVPKLSVISKVWMFWELCFEIITIIQMFSSLCISKLLQEECYIILYKGFFCYLLILSVFCGTNMDNVYTQTVWTDPFRYILIELQEWFSVFVLFWDWGHGLCVIQIKVLDGSIFPLYDYLVISA